MARQKMGLDDKYLTCMRCSKNAPRLNNINVSMLTTKAEYWRDMSEEIAICSQCAKELSDFVDSWWLEKGETKYNLKKEQEMKQCKKMKINTRSIIHKF